MNRNQKLRMNTTVGLLSQIVTLVCGFIVPKLILVYYGSEVNGLVSSVIHFLNFISLAEFGMGVVVQSSLYKPLAIRDEDEISRIIISSDRFFRKIGILLVIYVIVLAVVYPIFINTTYDYLYTCSLILAISIGLFVQYFFCMSYRLLVTADQVGYVQLGVQIFTMIANTICCVVFAMNGVSIQMFKLGTSLVFLAQPVLLTMYVRKHYKLNKKLPLHEEPIKQKWNGLSQHIAYVVLGNTDVVILTILSTLSNVSIYNVYYLVVNGIRCVITSAITGVQALLGNMYAKKEKENLMQAFSYFEWTMHTGVVYLYACTTILIVPFVRVYTLGITDADYIVSNFGILISLAQASFCLRMPYNMVVMAAGHYKQTQASALIEAGINIVVSVILVFQFGLVGVAVGTLVAMSYRTVYLAMYLTRNIIERPIWHFIKHIAVDACMLILSYAVGIQFTMHSVSYVAWIMLGVKITIIVGIICVAINLLFYNKFCMMTFRKVFRLK